MKHTIALKKNYEFRRLYSRGKRAVSPYLALYCRKNRFGVSRLGVTVGTKVGKAVRRNLVRRRIREAYRIHEGEFLPGYDIVAVARVRCCNASFRELERSLLQLLNKLGVRAKEERG